MRPGPLQRRPASRRYRPQRRDACFNRPRRRGVESQWVTPRTPTHCEKKFSLLTKEVKIQRI